MATYVCCAIQGLLNALVFSQDVAVARGFLALRMYLWQKYVEVYESRYPQLSKNKKNPRLGDRKKTRSIIPSRKMFKREESFELTTIKDNSTKKAVMESNNQNMIDVTSEETELELIWKPTFFEKLQYLMIIKLFKAPIDFDNILKEKNTSVFDDVGLQKFQDQSTLENNHILKPSTEPEFQKLGKLDISEDVTAASDPILPLRPYYSKNINFQKKWTLISEENPLPLHLNDTQRLKRFENWPNESSSKDMDDMIISEGSLSMAPSTLAVPKKTEIIHQNTYKRTFSIPSLDEETQDTASENLPNPNSPNTSFFDVFMKRL
ncbi:hypothetical protein G9A89_001046 [Geosiphon pyriformis]|nr:hypothetical protein G9A89_001046 [Geosiphon pyriformis]